jgi:hypothetical protein
MSDIKKPAFRRIFENRIKQYFPGSYSEILDNTDRKYHEFLPDVSFAATSSNPLDKRLKISAYFLAFIKILDQEGESYEKIKEICHKTILDYIKPKNGLQKRLKKIPVMLIGTRLASWFLKIMEKKVNKIGHREGFVAATITDKKETYGLGYGIDILECGICKLFNKHQMSKFTPIMCEVDRITTSLNGLELIRKGTIATGSDKCDFRFRKLPEIR